VCRRRLRGVSRRVSAERKVECRDEDERKTHCLSSSPPPCLASSIQSRRGQDGRCSREGCFRVLSLCGESKGEKDGIRAEEEGERKEEQRRNDGQRDEEGQSGWRERDMRKRTGRSHRANADNPTHSTTQPHKTCIDPPKTSPPSASDGRALLRSQSSGRGRACLDSESRT
jgi:hypothetical protein